MQQHLRYWIIDHNADPVWTKDGLPLIHVYSSWNEKNQATAAVNAMNLMKRRARVKMFDSDRLNQLPSD